MKHRPSVVERYEDEVYNLVDMFNGKKGKTYQDAYEQLAIKGIALILSTLDKIRGGLFFLIGLLIAAIFFRS